MGTLGDFHGGQVAMGTMVGAITWFRNRRRWLGAMALQMERSR